MARNDSMVKWSPATLRVISARKEVDVRITELVVTADEAGRPPQAVNISARTDRITIKRYIFFTPKIY